MKCGDQLGPREIVMLDLLGHSFSSVSPIWTVWCIALAWKCEHHGAPETALILSYEAFARVKGGASSRQK